MVNSESRDSPNLEAGEDFTPSTSKNPIVEDELLSQCSVEELKQMKCEKLNDCDFFDPD
jgi:hypothetical protein